MPNVTYVRVPDCETFLPLSRMMQEENQLLAHVPLNEWEDFKRFVIPETINECIEAKPPDYPDEEYVIFTHEHSNNSYEHMKVILGFFKRGFIERRLRDGDFTQNEDGITYSLVSPRMRVAHLN